MDKPRKIGGVWLSDSEKLFAKGRLDSDAIEKMGSDTKILVFKVDPEWKKENPRRPDFDICIASDDPKPNTEAEF